MRGSGGTILEPGRDDEWQRLDAEKRALLTHPPETSPGELLRRGQQLSAQAARLVRAIERGREVAPRP